KKSPFLETDDCIVTAMNHQGRSANLHEELTTISSAVDGLDIADRSFRISGGPLQVVEMSDQSRIAARKELRGENLAECRCILPPTLAHQRDQRLVFLRIVPRARAWAPTVRTVEDQMADALRAINRVGGCGPTTFGDA